MFDTPFMRFWDALNRHLVHRCGLPEITYGPARAIWEQAVSQAGAAVREGAMVPGDGEIR